MFSLNSPLEIFTYQDDIIQVMRCTCSDDVQTLTIFTDLLWKEIIMLIGNSKVKQLTPFLK